MSTVSSPSARVHPDDAPIVENEDWLRRPWGWVAMINYVLDRVEETRDAKRPRAAPLERIWLGLMRDRVRPHAPSRPARAARRPHRGDQVLLDEDDGWLRCHWCWMWVLARALHHIKKARDAQGPPFAPTERERLGEECVIFSALAGDYHDTDYRRRRCPMNQRGEARRGQ